MEYGSKSDKTFIMVLLGMIFLLTGLGTLAFYLITSSNLVLYNIILNILLIVAVGMAFFMMISVIMMVRLLKGNKLSECSTKWLSSFLRIIYLQMIPFSKILRCNQNVLMRVFVKINNALVLSKSFCMESKDILILLPHCLQKSYCPHKITNHIENCKKCGKCDIAKLLDIKEKYGVNIFVATGGTLARKIIKTTRPKAIIAVACERDLSSGILDVKRIPVIGVFNDRPEGPCINTRVDCERIEERIRFLIEKEE